MKKLYLLAAAVSLLAAVAVRAQSLDDLNIQIHGYATQGFLYTTNNNIFTTNSSNGSPEWDEAVVNVTAQPAAKLRVGVQARYFILGNLGNAITLDWAMADYKANDKFGVRFGKVKTPSGLFNEIQDIDPGYMWALLPQGVYPITSRNSLLAHYGGVVYGTLSSKTLGKLEYRGWGGEREIGSDDGYFIAFKEEGIVLPDGLNEIVTGLALHWRTPLPGLMAGASLNHSNKTTVPLTDTYVIPSGPEAGITITTNGNMNSTSTNQPDFFAKYERNRVMVAGEYTRTDGIIAMPVLEATDRYDLRGWFAMASYKLTDKLSAGAYQSQYFDTQVLTLGPARYSKDWAFSGRYDFSQYLYTKIEEHVIDGTSINYDAAMNAGGLKPNTKMMVLKVGVSF
jgi:hypothetical protein